MWRRFFKGVSHHDITPCSSVIPVEPELTVTIRQGEDGYLIAECLELPGCMSQGRTEPEAIRNITDAIQSCLAVRLEEFLKESRRFPADLVGIQAQETFRVKPVELEPVTC